VLREHSGWVALGTVLVVLVLALGIAGWAGMRGPSGGGAHRGGRWRRRPHRNEFRPEGAVTDAPRRRAAIVINPSKFDDVDAVRSRITRRCAALGWQEPLFVETTVEDPGTGQAREALEADVDLVCALGGDGTVRAVAAALVETETPMGLLPAGTGNLLARNLDLPIDSVEDALQVALTGQNKRIDVGRLSVDASRGEDEPPADHEQPADHVFLVMAGLGFDAAIMADAPEGLKAKVGPAAYVVSGARNLRGPSFRVRVKVDDVEEFSRRTRTVVIGNCGKLVGGLVLMPDAEVDDGQLDTVILSPKGVVGWAAVAARVASRRRKGHPVVDHYTSASIRIRADRPQEVQVDGDTLGKAHAIAAVVLPSSLVVRVGSPG
jgi:diacylglycerol kinase (ATP)